VPTPVVDVSGIRWVNYRGYRMPVTSSNGPRDTSGGLVSGFSDTPLGALLAAINIGALTAWQFGPAVFQPTRQRRPSICGQCVTSRSLMDRAAAMERAARDLAREGQWAAQLAAMDTPSTWHPRSPAAQPTSRRPREPTVPISRNP
jgi:hypothetical protein